MIKGKNHATFVTAMNKDCDFIHFVAAIVWKQKFGCQLWDYFSEGGGGLWKDSSDICTVLVSGDEK